MADQIETCEYLILNSSDKACFDVLMLVAQKCVKTNKLVSIEHFEDSRNDFENDMFHFIRDKNFDDLLTLPTDYDLFSENMTWTLAVILIKDIL